MSFVFPTNASQVQAFAGALFGVQAGSATMAQINADILANGGLAKTLNGYYSATQSSTAAAAKTVATNLGLTGAALTEGTAYITSQLNAAAADARGAVISNIVNMFGTYTTDANFGTAATAWNTKLAAAVAYTGSANVAVGTANAPVVVNPGIFALTTGINDFQGTTVNDTFTADVLTLNAADVLVGNAGIDTLNYTGTTNVALPAASITGIEVLNVRQIGAALAATDLSLLSGVTTVNYDRSNDAGTFTNMPAGGTYGVVGNAAVINTGALALGYAAGAAVTAATLNFSGGTLGAQAVTLTGANLLSTTINSTGAANVTGAFVDAASSKALTINATTGLTTGTIGDSAARTALTINATGNVTTGAVTSSAATTAAITGTGNVTTDLNLVVAPTITVSGSGAVSIGTLNAASTTLTSTQTAGGLTATMNAVATTKVTGGAGNDVITTGQVLTTGFANGGDGSDTLVIGTNVGHINTTALAAKFTNFETLRLQGTLDMAVAPSSITAVELNAGASVITNMNATQAAAVKAQGDLTTTTLTLATQGGTSDVLNLKMGTGLTTAPATNSGVLTITGFETLNLSTNAGPTATAVANRTSTITGAIVDTSLTNVNLTGTAFVFTDIASSKAVAWNGSALIGDGNTTASSVKGLTVAGNAFAGSTITGSDFVDSLTIGAVGSTYNAGGGNDLVIATQAVFAGSVAVDGGAGTSDVQRITDVATSTNTVTIDDNAFKVVSGFESVNFSGATAGDFLWSLGGYANAVATANGGVITATNTALVTGVTGDIITVDASGLSGTNALKLTMTNTGLAAAAVTSPTTITGSGGADTIVYTEAGVVGGNNQRTITINGGNGNDSITVSSVAVGAIAITGGLGNDIIVGSVQADTITGGTGQDTMTGGGTTANIFAFVAGDSGLPSATNFDAITDFAAVAANVISVGAQLVLASASTAVSGTAGFGAADGVRATFNAADNTFALKLAAVEKGLSSNTNTNLELGIFVDGIDTYVFIADGVAGIGANDILIKLVGVTGTDANFDVATLAGQTFTLA